VKEAPKDFNAGAKITLFNDSTVQIASSLSVLTTNALMGLGILVIVLWLFIGLRNALMTALGIPVAFALTFLVLDLMGETINTNTLFGLVLVLGLVVDHAIVVIENSYRLKLSGFDRHQSAIVGTDQVVWPVIAATGTTVAAFLPLMIIPGTIGKFLRVIPLTVTIALLASTAESLIILPSHFADWGKRREAKTKQKKKLPGQWFNPIQKGYGNLLKTLYHFKKTVLLIAIIITVLSFSLIATLNTDLFSAEDFSYFTIDIATPIGSSISSTDTVVKQFEEVLLSKLGQGEIVSISSSVGSSSSSITSAGSNTAQITVDLYEMDEGRTQSIDEIIEEIKKETYYIAGADQVFYRKAQNGPPSSQPLGYRLSGDNYSALIEASQDIMSYLGSIEKVNTIESDYQKGSPELRIRLNEERASALGITVTTLGSFVRSRFEGIDAGIFFEDNKEVPIVVRTDYNEVEKYAYLEQSLIPTTDGRLIPFSSIATIELGSSFGSIKRVDGKREIQVSADIEEGVETNTIDQMVSEYWENELQDKYQGISFSAGGDFAEFSSLLLDILRVFLLGIFLIYLILGAQFNSYSQPLLILLSVPFAFVGVILYLFFSGTPFSTTVIYAGVALAGIAVNDAIVLISFINELIQKGTAVSVAIVEAAKQRIRPILLTSLTTIGGLLPTAIGIGGTSVVWGPMASTIMFGLIFSTLSALIVIPLLYGLLYDRKTKKPKGSTV
jgi:multidrug efflux pump subunit AcrB